MRSSPSRSTHSQTVSLWRDRIGWYLVVRPKSWKDQRLLWIEPYWKGPELGALIERAYELSP